MEFLWGSGGQFEVGMRKLINAFLDEGVLSLNAGSNIGLVTLPAARRVGPIGQDVAVEPAFRTCELFQRSMAVHHAVDRVILHRCIAGDETGIANRNLGINVGRCSRLALPGSVSSE